MANSGFGITATQINKVVGSGEWTDEVRVNCYQAAAIAELPDVAAYTQFVFLCNLLGIRNAGHTKLTNTIYADTFSVSGKVENTLSDTEKRKQIAEKLFGDATKHILLKDIKGDDLSVMYDANCGKSKDDTPFVIHRIVVGQNIVYRVCQDGQDVKGIIKEAIRYIIKFRDGKEDEYKDIL